MSRPRHRRVLPALAVSALVVLAGCAESGPPAQAPLSLGLPAQTFTAGPAPPQPTPARTEVPQSCGELVPVAGLLEVLAVPLQGESTFVYAGPIPESGRTGRITCGYGVTEGPDGQPVPSVEVTLNGYVDDATAAGRLEASVASARQQGDDAQALDLDGRPGFVLTDAAEVSYLLAEGPRTVVVTLRRGLVPPAAERLVLVDLAALALGLPASGSAG